MKWLTESELLEFLKTKDYDIRKSHSARWIDQKCTADVITLVADCVNQYIAGDLNKLFWRGDIQLFEYTMSNIKYIFKKPGTHEPLAENEYDKFFSQPLELLAYAGVLERKKVSRKNYYTVKNPDILEYLAMREKNSLSFLNCYIHKVMSDSGLYPLFEAFFSKQTNAAYHVLRTGFIAFTMANTPVNGTLECGRIFTKVVNPLAYFHNSKGTQGGHLSKHKITLDMLMYNRDNFRDVYMDKPKEMTRAQYAEKMGISLRSSYTAYLSQKAKRTLKLFNEAYRGGRTEVYDERHISDAATHIHHIFPEASYPEICAYYENLIALTPTQHLNYSHPNGNTRLIDEAFQHICLLAKLESIYENLTAESVDIIYDFSSFMFVLYIGLENELFNEIEPMDFESAVNEINRCYT